MNNLRQVIERQAMDFATNIVRALRGASLDELINVTDRAGSFGPGTAKTKPVTLVVPEGRGRRAAGVRGRLGRRSVEEIEKTLQDIVQVLGRHPQGLRAEELKNELGLDKRELPRPLSDGVKAGLLTKAGRKRATTYFVSGDSKRKRSS
jgi:hypothetical protein